MNIIAEIRRGHFVSKESISSIARSLGVLRPAVRKHLQTEAEPVYQHQIQIAPKLGEFKVLLMKWLEAEALLPKSDAVQPCDYLKVWLMRAIQVLMTVFGDLLNNGRPVTRTHLH